MGLSNSLYKKRPKCTQFLNLANEQRELVLSYKNVTTVGNAIMALFSIASYWNFMLRVEKIILNGNRKNIRVHVSMSKKISATTEQHLRKLSNTSKNS